MRKQSKRNEPVSEPLFPPKGAEKTESTQFSLRFPKPLLRRVEALARQLGYRRTEMIIRLVAYALEENDKRSGK